MFVLLVAASVGAFFLTTRLKRSTPLVQGLTFSRHLSPNGDGRHDVARIRFRTKREDEVTVAIVNEDGEDVRTLASDRLLPAGPHRFRWNGRIEGDGRAPDGEYRIRIALRRQGRGVTSPRKLFVDTRPPRPVVRYVAPDSISPDGVGSAERARLRFDGTSRATPRLLVYRTDVSQPRVVARRDGRKGSNELTWDGHVNGAGGSRPAPTGNYLLLVRTRDAAGNVGPPTPPTRRRVKGHPGLRVSYLSALAPPSPARAGDVVAFPVSSDGRRYRWNVRRLGSSRALERGSSSASTLRVRAPRGRSGTFMLRLRSGAHRYATPFAVQASRRRPVLVVLPETTWQARNDVDGDGNGFGDTLPEDRSVALRRPFARGLPPGFTAHSAPILSFLDRNGLRYDIATDLSLTASSARPPIRYSGLLYAGPPRFFTGASGRLVRAYVDAGGRVAWVGTAGLTQPVQAAGDRISVARSPTARGLLNLFGEGLYDETATGPLTVLSDQIDFFRGVGGSFGPFIALEEREHPPPAARLLASAGREAERPALAVYRWRKGIVARIGADGFGSAADRDPDVARIMRRLWTLLSR